MELHQQGGPLGQIELGIAVAGFDLQFIKQFDPCDRNAALDGQDHRVACTFQIGKVANPARDALRNAGQFQRHFGDDA